MPDTTEAGAPVIERTLTARIRRLRDALTSGLVERDVAVRLALLAAMSGEHLLLLGPPGTAKSLVARRLRLAFREATYFERLLTRFTVPEELFGPLSIKGLEHDRYERLTESYLPRASIAFLDEIFKANSAILNALLTLLNERLFDNGTRRDEAPLLAAVGASNELPEGEELTALFDRFLLRLHVGPVSKGAFTSLIGLRGQPEPEVPVDAQLSAAELREVQLDAQRVAVPEDVVALLGELREWCGEQSVPVSDRRWRKIVAMLQVSAWTNGREAVSIWDCWLLQFAIGDSVEQREKVREWYAARVGATKAMDPSQLTAIIASWEGKLRKDQLSRSQMRDLEGNALYWDSSKQETTNARGAVPASRGDEPLFLAPAEGQFHDGQRWIRVADRSNRNTGYTREELMSQAHLQDGTEFKRWAKRTEYLADPANRLTVETDLTPKMEPTRHKSVHVDNCREQLRIVDSKVAEYTARLENHAASLRAEIEQHLWVMPDFATRATEVLANTRQQVAQLQVRLAGLFTGFDALPRDPES